MLSEEVYTTSKCIYMQYEPSCLITSSHFVGKNSAEPIFWFTLLILTLRDLRVVRTRPQKPANTYIYIYIIYMHYYIYIFVKIIKLKADGTTRQKWLITFIQQICNLEAWLLIWLLILPLEAK